MAARFHAVPVAQDTADVEAHQWPHIRHLAAVGAKNAHDPPVRPQRGRHLVDPVVLAAQVGIDLAQKPHLLRVRQFVERTLVAVETTVGRRRAGVKPAIAPADGPHGLRGPANGGFRQFRRVGIGCRVLDHAAQPETLNDVVVGVPEAPVVEGERLRMTVLQEEFAIVRANERVADNPGDAALVHVRAPEEQFIGCWNHVGFPASRRMCVP